MFSIFMIHNFYNCLKIIFPFCYKKKAKISTTNFPLNFPSKSKYVKIYVSCAHFQFTLINKKNPKFNTEKKKKRKHSTKFHSFLLTPLDFSTPHPHSPGYVRVYKSRQNKRTHLQIDNKSMFDRGRGRTKADTRQNL